MRSCLLIQVVINPIQLITNVHFQVYQCKYTRRSVQRSDMPPSQSQSSISYDRDRTPITSPSERFRAIYDATQVSPPSVPASISVSPRPTRSASLNYSKINSSSSMGMGRRREPSPPLPPLPPLQSPTSSHSHPHPVRSNSVGGPGIRSPQRVVRPTIVPSSSSSSSSSGMRQQKQQNANKMPPRLLVRGWLFLRYVLNSVLQGRSENWQNLIGTRR